MTERVSPAQLFLWARIFETCKEATAQAEQSGREFTPVYWYHGEDGKQPPVLTLWDMNPPKMTFRTKEDRYTFGWTDPRANNSRGTRTTP